MPIFIPDAPPWGGTPAPVATRIDAARRLFAMSIPVRGTAAEAYLRTRAITMLTGAEALRFHPGCYYRDEAGKTLALPALIAATTDDAGGIMGVHRTWLAPGGAGKAQVATPRRAMGVLLGHGVRFGTKVAGDRGVMAAGEGFESMLSLRMALSCFRAICGGSISPPTATGRAGTERSVSAAAPLQPASRPSPCARRSGTSMTICAAAGRTRCAYT